ncbi:MAG: YeeE/YedE family protein [Candidatus Eisenbacteria bacterium]|uniref:YeeE/YedE family protein n=1 Tax=Eiseniibacteriota bacterium TaxID=2212470 RepID=A0A7Y2EAC7_UNCEI|nr:YeeE/YedE family protein [Candidatus Eisenbacteria bacterium]
MQEMFRFQGFHMYGVLFSAAGVTAVGFAVLKRVSKGWSGREIVVPPKPFKGAGTQYWLGGLCFGAGWGMTGACPGPIFSLIGNGFMVMIVVLLAALVGAWVYGALQTKLPH